MTCRHCSSPEHRIEHCPEVVIAFGPTRRTCRRCINEAAEGHMYCEECALVKQAETRTTARDYQRHYKRARARKAKR